MELFAAVISGALIGFLYAKYIGCRIGTCAIVRNKYASAFTGALVGLMLVTSGCADSGKEPVISTSPQIQQTATIQSNHKLDNKDFAEKMKMEGAVLIDVRTPEEFAAGHLKNAININVNGATFAQDIAELDKEKLTLIYCKSGTRSEKAFVNMSDAGFVNMFTLANGFSGWNGEVVK